MHAGQPFDPKISPKGCRGSELSVDLSGDVDGGADGDNDAMIARRLQDEENSRLLGSGASSSLGVGERLPAQLSGATQSGKDIRVTRLKKLGHPDGKIRALQCQSLKKRCSATHLYLVLRIFKILIFFKFFKSHVMSPKYY